MSGEVNYETAPRIREAFERLIQEGSLRIALDCSSVDFIDSSGIGAIVHEAQVLKKAGGFVTLQSANRQFVHALQVSGFAQLVGLEGNTPAIRSAVRPSASASEGSSRWQKLRFCIPLAADTDGSVRKRVTELAQSMPFTQDEVDDIRLAVGEAVSNAVRHGCRDRHLDKLTVCCTGDAEKLVIEIHNPGEPFDPGAIPDPEPDSLREGGMGIFFMKTAMHDVRYGFDETGTTVTMVKYMGNGESYE